MRFSIGLFIFLMSIMFLPIVLAAQFQQIVPSDLEAGDRFGHATAVSGDYAIIGSYRESSFASAAGTAYIFKRNATGQYVQVNRLNQSKKEANAFFGNAVSIYENYSLVGAYNEDASGSNSGAVYVFSKNATGQYVQTQKLLSLDLQTEDSFGNSISQYEDYALIGAVEEDTVASNAGAAYVFKRNATGQYVQTQKLTGSGTVLGDNFGNSVSLYEDYAFVGSKAYGGAYGGVFIFKRNSTGTYEPFQVIQAGDKEVNDYFGYYVSADGNYLVVGAPLEDSRGSASGAAYIFKQNATGHYVQTQKLIGYDSAASDTFGSSAAIQGTLIAVGSPENDDGGSNAGAVYVFGQNSSGQYEILEKIQPDITGDNYYFGFSCGIDSGYVLGGADRVSLNGVSSGGEYSFKFDIPDGEIESGCPSIPQNWNVDMSQNIVLNSVCDLTGYNITFYNSGSFTVNSTITFNQLKNLSSGMTVWLKPAGILNQGGV